jgi:hypothetical protein
MASNGSVRVILTVLITLSVCPFNRMAHTTNSDMKVHSSESQGRQWIRGMRHDVLFS